MPPKKTLIKALSLSLLTQSACVVGAPCEEGTDCEQPGESFSEVGSQGSQHCELGARWELVPLSATFDLDEADEIGVEDRSDPSDIVVEVQQAFATAGADAAADTEDGWRVDFTAPWRSWKVTLGDVEWRDGPSGGLYARAWDNDGWFDDKEPSDDSVPEFLKDGDDILQGFEVILLCDPEDASPFDGNPILVDELGDGLWHEIVATGHTDYSDRLRLKLRYLP